MNKFVNYKDVDINQGFWCRRQKLNSSVTVNAVYERFKETGRFDALKQNWKEGEPNKPHIFWDSDIAKWMEAAAYIIEKNNDKTLLAICEDMLDTIAEKQAENGYFNSYFQLIEPEAIYTRRTHHELYTAGHLIEAMVAYYDVTGNEKALNVACKLADNVEEAFKIAKTATFITPGHEEIELALVKLWRCTKEKRYLELAKFFIDMRGVNEEYGDDWQSPEFTQSHLPVREQKTAEGHSVRAGYLYTGMADVALETDDEELKAACKTIFENITKRKMYITGGIGTTSVGEAFTVEYDLPNESAYAESCAAIALMFFAKRMMELDMCAEYADIIEKVLYNGFLSSVSLDGKAFFYVNPLEIIPKFEERYSFSRYYKRGDLPPMQRAEIFTCSCCPPNITRFIASLGGYIFSEDEETLFIHQYISCASKNVILESGFPSDGKVRIKGNGSRRIAMRIPGWCENYKIKLGGNDATYTIENGYAFIECEDDFEITADFDMPVVLMQSNVDVTQNVNKICVTRGPVVYCAEGVDNEYLIHRVFVDEKINARTKYDEYFDAHIIDIDAYMKKTQDLLYTKIGNKYEKVNLRLIPYFAFANRGVSEMMVWLNRKI